MCLACILAVNACWASFCATDMTFSLSPRTANGGFDAARIIKERMGGIEPETPGQPCRANKHAIIPGREP
jgi:hypothetical protein